MLEDGLSAVHLVINECMPLAKLKIGESLVLCCRERRAPHLYEQHI